MAICPFCEGNQIRPKDYYKGSTSPPLDSQARSLTACGLCLETGEVSDELAVLVRLADRRTLRKLELLTVWSQCPRCRGTGRLLMTTMLPECDCDLCSGRGRTIKAAGEDELLRVFS